MTKIKRLKSHIKAYQKKKKTFMFTAFNFEELNSLRIS